jgi:acyl-CoA synthetase (AMP-forming)/AMP-acid ligase II
VRDAEGYFFVTGRIKELIIKGGENIAPREIDEVLLRHPAVLDAAAVGVPDRHYGQEVMACVILREGAAASGEELRAFCVERLGAFKAPKSIRFVRELPRGPSGKVQRLKLAQMESG